MEYISTLKFTTVDYFTLVVLLVSALIGISRGLFKEVLALASWFVAAWVAYHYSYYLSTEWLSTFHLDELLSLGISFLILFILTLIDAWRLDSGSSSYSGCIDPYTSKCCLAKGDYTPSY